MESYLHAGMGLLFGEIASQTKVGDTNVSMFIQQDISWLHTEAEKDTEVQADTECEITHLIWETMFETLLIHDLSYNFRSL